MVSSSRKWSNDNSGATLGMATALGVIGLALCAVPQALEWHQARFAQQLADHAAKTEGGVARLQVRQLAERGPGALPALVRLAGASTDSAAADAARDALAIQLAGWTSAFRTTGDAVSLGHRLAKLATALDATAAGFDAGGRAWARGAALEVTRLCDPLRTSEAAPILAACDRVLSLPDEAAPPTVATAVPGQRTPPRAVAPAAPVWFPPRPRAAAGVASPGLDASAASLHPRDGAEANVNGTAGGDLEVVAAPVAGSGGNSTVQREAKLQARGRAVAEGRGEEVTAPRVAPLEPRPQPLPAPASDSALVDVPPPQRQRVMMRRFRQMADGELASALTTAGPFEELMIQGVFRERQATSTRNARRLAPAPAQNPAGDATQQLADRVSQLPAKEARRVLRELAVDAAESAETRLAALTLLATSGDPQLAAIARQRALEDADPRVAELATKILREQQTR